MNTVKNLIHHPLTDGILSTINTGRPLQRYLENLIEVNNHGSLLYQSCPEPSHSVVTCLGVLAFRPLPQRLKGYFVKPGMFVIGWNRYSTWMHWLLAEMLEGSRTLYRPGLCPGNQRI